jgi:hypothetical protein
VGLLPGEEMETGLGLFCQSLGAVITRGDFKVEAPDFPALVFVLDAKIRDRNLVVHNLEVVFVCDPDSFAGAVHEAVVCRSHKDFPYVPVARLTRRLLSIAVWSSALTAISQGLFRSTCAVTPGIAILPEKRSEVRNVIGAGH